MTLVDKVALIGSGSWGTAASGLVAPHVRELCMWTRTTTVAEAINATHHNPRHLTDYELPERVRASDSLESALDGASAIVMAVPSAFLRATARSMAPHVGQDTPVIVLTKGIEPGTHLLMADVLAGELGNPARMVALSGPNHAEEICLGKVSAAVAASRDEGLTCLSQGLFMSPTFRVYQTNDLTGVEVCAAVKNVMAIACGICVGLGFGDNTLAALMTRGLAEIGRISSALGGEAITCMGLAGMGDLVATCTSQHSRNRTFGEAFSRGESLASYERRTGMVVEGARTALSAWELACELSIEAPLTTAVHAILYGNARLDEVVDSLLDRRARVEFYGLTTNE